MLRSKSQKGKANNLKVTSNQCLDYMFQEGKVCCYNRCLRLRTLKLQGNMSQQGMAKVLAFLLSHRSFQLRN
jgi:hypothetical protein